MSLCQKISHLLTGSKNGQKRFLMFCSSSCVAFWILAILGFFLDKGAKQNVDMELGSINKWLMGVASILWYIYLEIQLVAAEGWHFTMQGNSYERECQIVTQKDLPKNKPPRLITK